ncbi:hypothetical protein KQX54_009209 [Cotesia glomerata]|uniref:Uncharacterized protein n=1 Tax=Cotesia glomerata TaxID=32391 RepID=A0AAV7IE98_COTGL|nr:hypothetical protein KQX54_009209 [Cotesia glomerata]
MISCDFRLRRPRAIPPKQVWVPEQGRPGLITNQKTNSQEPQALRACRRSINELPSKQERFLMLASRCCPSPKRLLIPFGSDWILSASPHAH